MTISFQSVLKCKEIFENIILYLDVNDIVSTRHLCKLVVSISHELPWKRIWRNVLKSSAYGGIDIIFESDADFENLDILQVLVKTNFIFKRRLTRDIKYLMGPATLHDKSQVAHRCLREVPHRFKINGVLACSKIVEHCLDLLLTILTSTSIDFVSSEAGYRPSSECHTQSMEDFQDLRQYYEESAQRRSTRERRHWLEARDKASLILFHMTPSLPGLLGTIIREYHHRRESMTPSEYSRADTVLMKAMALYTACVFVPFDGLSAAIHSSANPLFSYEDVLTLHSCQCFHQGVFAGSPDGFIEVIDGILNNVLRAPRRRGYLCFTAMAMVVSCNTVSRDTWEANRQLTVRALEALKTITATLESEDVSLQSFEHNFLGPWVDLLFLDGATCVKSFTDNRIVVPHDHVAICFNLIFVALYAYVHKRQLYDPATTDVHLWGHQSCALGCLDILLKWNTVHSFSEGWRLLAVNIKLGSPLRTAAAI